MTRRTTATGTGALIGVMLVLAGCGGGGLSSSSSETEGAEQGTSTVSAAVLADSLADERARVRQADPKRDGHVFTKLYVLSSDQYVRGLERNTRLRARLSHVLYGSGRSFRQTLAPARRLWAQSMSLEVTSWKRYRDEVSAVRTTTDLQRSAKDYERDELDRSIRLFGAFADHLREYPAGRDRLTYYNALTPGQRVDPIAVGAVTNRPGRQQKLVRAFTRDIERTTSAASTTARAPAVGDAYRTVIADGFLPTSKKDSRRREKITERAWMLYRIAELEDTPQAAYEMARDTLLLESVDDPRNRYTQLIGILKALDSAYPGRASDLPDLRAYLRWARTELTKPIPPILVSTRDGFLRELATIKPDADSAARSFLEAQARIGRIMRRGAKRVDSPQQLRSALVAALDATRRQQAG